ncbi:MAG: AI-2E family transporter [Butyrivibrio sp.]|nr:AI-2E family transporter [Butyrivibrio sp.]
MRFDKKKLDIKWVGYTIATCSAVILYMALSHLDWFFSLLGYVLDAVAPVTIGIVVAYVLNPAVKAFYEKVFKKVKSDKTRNNLSILAAMCCLIFLLTILIVSMIPQIVSSVMGFMDNFESYAGSLTHAIAQVGHTVPQISGYANSLSLFSENLLGRITDFISSNSSTIINTSYSIGRSFFDGFIGFIIAIYLLADKFRIKKGLTKLLHLIFSDKQYHDYSSFWKRCNDILVKYIVFDLVDGLIVGVTNAIFMLIAGVPYVVLISVIVGVFNLLPTFGPIVGGFIGAFLLILVNPWYALYFLIFTVVLQIIDAYIVKPKLFGGSLGLPGVLVLITVIVGGKIFGVAGILLSIPFAAIFVIVYDEYFIVKLQERKEKAEKAKKETVKAVEDAAFAEKIEDQSGES